MSGPPANILGAALWYAERCRRVLPVRRETKAPLVEDWPNRATTDPATIRGWFKKWPKANVGGLVAPGEIIVDVDPGGLEWCKGMDLSLPSTRTVRTGRGGLHLYYAAEPDALNGASQVKLGPNVDSRLPGKGQVLLPPSIHENGELYAFDGAPDAAMAEAPDWVLDTLRAGGWQESSSTAAPAASPERRPLGSELPLSIPQGARHGTLMRWAAKWRELGYGKEEASVLFYWLLGRCEQPPGDLYTDAEADKLFEDVWRRYPPGDPPAVRHSPEPTPDAARTVKAIDLLEFETLDIPVRRALLSPFLLEKSLGQCFAARGVGKTHVSLGVAYAVASGGSFLQWSAERPAGVLLVDGEMAATDLQARLRAIAAGSDKRPAPGKLQIVAYDLQGEGGLPSLATPEGQAAIEHHLDGVELVILDNLSCLFDLPENDADRWKQDAQPWLMSLRRRGHSVMFMHHAGQSGQQRGTTAREDVLDYVLRLKHPSGYEHGQPARFVVHFTKARQLGREGLSPFEARLETTDSGAAVWTCHNAGELLRTRALEMVATEGMSLTAIARELGVDKSTVCRWKQKAKGG